MSGCALLAAPAVEEVGSLADVAGAGTTGFMGTESTVAVNKSWIKNNDIQARYYSFQLRRLSRQDDFARKKRASAVGILKSMAILDNDPQIADLAQWVENGGDPQFALDHALARDQDDAARAAAVRILQNMSENEDNPAFYDLAQWVRAGGDAKFALSYALDQSATTGSPAAVITSSSHDRAAPARPKARALGRLNAPPASSPTDSMQAPHN